MKFFVLLGDFNLNLLNTSDKNVSESIDILENYVLLPYITLPTRITDTSQTLIDNIFLSPHSYKSFSGNLLTGISDHLARFVLLEKSLSGFNYQTKTFKDWKNFDAENFESACLLTDWPSLLKLDKRDPNYSFDIFYRKLNSLID